MNVLLENEWHVHKSFTVRRVDICMASCTDGDLHVAKTTVLTNNFSCLLHEVVNSVQLLHNARNLRLCMCTHACKDADI